MAAVIAPSILSADFARLGDEIAKFHELLAQEREVALHVPGLPLGVGLDALGGSAGVLFLVVLFASLIPARRASGVDPMEALRLKPARLFVIRRGSVIAETTPVVSRLSLADRTDEVDFRFPAELHLKGIRCDEYIIMPDHFYAIIQNIEPVGADLCVCPVDDRHMLISGEHIGSPLHPVFLFP